MTLSKMYRARAAALAEQAKSTLEPIPKERFKRMAIAYERLAERYATRVRVYKKMPNVAVEGPKKSKLRKRLLQMD
jgi:hypothetical protein